MVAACHLLVVCIYSKFFQKEIQNNSNNNKKKTHLWNINGGLQSWLVVWVKEMLSQPMCWFLLCYCCCMQHFCCMVGLLAGRLSFIHSLSRRALFVILEKQVKNWKNMPHKEKFKQYSGTQTHTHCEKLLVHMHYQMREDFVFNVAIIFCVNMFCCCRSLPPSPLCHGEEIVNV